MEGIGASIVNGAAGALLSIILHVPLIVWMILMGATVIFGILMRYLTNWKVDAVIVGVFLAFSLIVYYRAHWINIGYNEAVAKVNAAKAEMEGYKKTEGLIQSCYAQNRNATYLWDRTQGKCLRSDGAL